MATFPGVKAFIDATHSDVVQNKFVETLWGRRQYYYDLALEGKDADKMLARQKRMSVNFRRLSAEVKPREFGGSRLTTSRCRGVGNPEPSAIGIW